MPAAEGKCHVNGLTREAIKALPGAVYMTNTEGCITFYNRLRPRLRASAPKLGESKFCGCCKLY
jgi:hypothetical protein